MKKPWSLWWWAPPVLLGLVAALIPAEPHYSPHSLSDHLVLARQVLLSSAALYLFGFLIFRFLHAAPTTPPQEDPRRGFEIIPPKQNHGSADGQQAALAEPRPPEMP